MAMRRAMELVGSRAPDTAGDPLGTAAAHAARGPPEACPRGGTPSLHEAFKARFRPGADADEHPLPPGETESLRARLRDAGARRTAGQEAVTRQATPQPVHGTPHEAERRDPTPDEGEQMGALLRRIRSQPQAAAPPGPPRRSGAQFVPRFGPRSLRAAGAPDAHRAHADGGARDVSAQPAATTTSTTTTAARGRRVVPMADIPAQFAVRTLFANPGEAREYAVRLAAARRLLTVIPLGNLAKISGDATPEVEPAETQRADLLRHLMNVGGGGYLDGLRCTIILVRAHQLKRGVEAAAAGNSLGGRSMLKLLEDVDADAQASYYRKDPAKRGDDDAAGRSAMPARYGKLVTCASKLGYDYAVDTPIVKAYIETNKLGDRSDIARPTPELRELLHFCSATADTSASPYVRGVASMALAIASGVVRTALANRSGNVRVLGQFVTAETGYDLKKKTRSTRERKRLLCWPREGLDGRTCAADVYVATMAGCDAIGAMTRCMVDSAGKVTKDLNAASSWGDEPMDWTGLGEALRHVLSTTFRDPTSGEVMPPPSSEKRISEWTPHMLKRGLPSIEAALMGQGPTEVEAGAWAGSIAATLPAARVRTQIEGFAKRKDSAGVARRYSRVGMLAGAPERITHDFNAVRDFVSAVGGIKGVPATGGFSALSQWTRKVDAALDEAARTRVADDLAAAGQGRLEGAGAAPPGATPPNLAAAPMALARPVLAQAVTPAGARAHCEETRRLAKRAALRCGLTADDAARPARATGWLATASAAASAAAGRRVASKHGAQAGEPPPQ